jgi:5,10-methylenetetrahydrofolate reductase
MSSLLQNKINDPRQGVYFIGTTPPKASIEAGQMIEIAEKFKMRLESLEYDGLIVYDIQDESSRIDKPRPFPFAGTKDPRAYSALLRKLSIHPVITYKSIAQRSRKELDNWLKIAWEKYEVRDLVLVGSPSQNTDIKLSLNQAYQTLAESPYPFNLGGVTIAERHRKKGDEHLRLQKKVDKGCSYFISQAVYDADATISLLESYGERCRKDGTAPKRIILTFTPCGSQQTVDFMKWLGISVPADVRSKILSAKNQLEESVNVCHEHLNRIMDACPLNIPIGLNIESLTNRKEEIEASIKLYKLLKQTLDERLRLERPYPMGEVA